MLKTWKPSSTDAIGREKRLDLLMLLAFVKRNLVRLIALRSWCNCVVFLRGGRCYNMLNVTCVLNITARGSLFAKHVKAEIEK